MGGGEISLLNLLMNLDREKFRPFVLVPQEGNFSKQLKDLDINVFTHALNTIKNPLNIFHTVKTVKKLNEIIRHYNIELVHSNSSGGVAILGSIASRIMRIPSICHLRIVDSGRIVALIQSTLSSRTIVISEAVKRIFSWMPVKRKLILTYNGVDLSRFNVSVNGILFRNEMGLKQNDFLIGTVGRFIPLKGYEYLIRAAAVVLERIPRARFIIVGLDYDKNIKHLSDLRRLIKKLNLGEKITFLKTRNDIPEIMSALDLFAFPSVDEPFGRVLIEAMACGKAVVAFKSGGVPEIVDEGVTGILVPPRDFRGMAEKMIYLLQNRKVLDQLGRNGRIRAEKLFSIEANVEKTEKIYRQLTQKMQ
jgi:glycosyltransferase involved in cell wall biosynthesis